MSTRAYKLAEELGIDRNEFVAKAKEAGIELRNAMATLDEAQSAFLREKLSAKKSDRSMEARVGVTGGASVIRRRKRTEPELAPEPIPSLPEPTPIAVASAPSEEPLVDGEAPLATEPTAEVEGEDGAIAAAPAAGEEDDEDAQAKLAARSRAGTRDDAATPAADRAAQSRKQFREVVNLREQDMLAKQVVGRTAAARPVVIDPRTLSSPRRKRRDAPVKKSVAAAAAAKVP